MVDDLYDDDDQEDGTVAEPEDDPQPGEIRADDPEANEDYGDEPEVDDGLLVRTGIIPDDAI